MSFGQPFAESCENPGRDDWWTCPGCYTDLGDVGQGEHRCTSCDRVLVCSVVYNPACRAELQEAEE